MIKLSRSGPWPPTIASGLLWGFVVMLLDTLSQPVGDLSFLGWLQFSSDVLLQWCLVGTFWAIAARFIERRGLALIGYFLALPVSWGVTTLGDMLVQPVLTGGGGYQAMWMEARIPDADNLVYLCWQSSFYGGAYLLGYVATRRSVRLRQRLAAMLRARSEADVQFREARLRTFRGQLQPELMVGALAALREHARTDPVAADVVFDRLVSFLRAAMPAVRSGESTLANELSTLGAYGDLRDLISLDEARFRLEVPTQIGDFPFPPLALLPALNSFGHSLPPDNTLTLTVQSIGGETKLRIEATPPSPLPRGIGGPLKAALRLAFGEGISFVEDLSGRPALEIRLQSQQPATLTSQQGGDYVTS